MDYSFTEPNPVPAILIGKKRFMDIYRDTVRGVLKSNKIKRYGITTIGDNIFLTGLDLEEYNRLTRYLHENPVFEGPELYKYRLIERNSV